jgi:hypothetical protein
MKHEKLSPAVAYPSSLCGCNHKESDLTKEALAPSANADFIFIAQSKYTTKHFPL